MILSKDMTAKEILNDFKENYGKVRKLLDEDSKNDPENNPYMSKYKAKEILSNMKESFIQMRNSETSFDKIKLDAMLGTVLLNIGIIDMETEEITASEKIFTEAEELLMPNSSNPEIVITLIGTYNNLGILWCNRDEHEKSKTYLLKAKDLYETFKCTLQIPLPIEQITNNAGENSVDDFLILEKAHTLSLYYLAQVYGHLKKDLKSAIYYHLTLRRQLQYNDYEPIDWALSCATLSQYFAERNGFFQSRHHLSVASIILEQHELSLQSSESNDEVHLAKMETYNHRSADVARCWVKYCLLLMDASKARLMNDSETLIDAITDMSNLEIDDSENICGGDMKKLVFPDLDVAKYESKVTDKYLLTYSDAREVFLNCQAWLNKAMEYYKLDSLASDYIAIIQDSSQSYSYLAFFEEDDERRAKMHKRRIDMLEDLIKEINPAHYLQFCRELWFELGVTYSDILTIKLDKIKSTEKPTPQALKKINMLCEKSIEHYEHFIESIKDKNGKVPKKLDYELIKPVISVYAFIGKNSMKRIAIDKNMQLEHVKESYEAYKSVVDICTNDEEAAAMMHAEFSLCKEMVDILPLKIRKLQSELLS